MAETRRGALRWVVRGLSLGLGLLYAIPAVRYLAGRRDAELDERVDLGAVDALPEGVPHRAAVVSRAADAWSAGKGGRGAVFLVRHGQAVRAFDSTCPHTGCAVEWDEGERHFRCPCHKSSFDAEGERLAGPAPRGLDPQDVEIANGRVRLRYRRYRSGRPDRVPT